MTKNKHGLCDFAQRAQNQNIMIFALASNVSDFFKCHPQSYRIIDINMIKVSKIKLNTDRHSVIMYVICIGDGAVVA